MSNDLRNRISRIVHDARRSNEGSDIVADRILAEIGAVRVREAAQAERERCMRIVSAARMGDIDTDFRTLLHFIESGDTMQYNEERSQYEHDSRRRDYELLRAIAEGKDDE